ncbi:penicillin amidase [Ekhidna lutea]|uniref:Penicillin amidase n=1 Tax=Ekhidna lutea TaxID=447679 RepID=A0A239HTK6_EKHLU|nr:penicillin acylase family protein [Ekhidna lutea]SNS83584.1 penicillin amidase [Ekhidna lutea]
MKTFRFVLSLSITLALGIALNSKIESIPPLGKFLSPFHGFWQNAENEAIDIQSASQDSLTDSVNVYFDEILIPHVFAKNEKDLFFTQGYVTAYHRLWQMEFQLYSAAGRLAEILGPSIGNTSLVEIDRRMRRIGLMYGAKKSEELFKKEEPEVYALIEAYTAGVNAYIQSLDYKDYPIEYKLLDYKPEDWTTLKCFLLISNMNNMLSRRERDLEHTNAIKKWGREVFNTLYPERPDTIDPVIPAGTEFNFEPIQVEKPDVTFPLEFTEPLVEGSNEDNGSNSFVVNGEKTANGRVILTNEPDLSLNLPSIWYVMHLNSPSLNVMGATLPGGPGVIIGFNDSIAWGNTNAKRDLVDWYKIQFKDQSREEYLYNDNWVPTKKVIEEIKVRGSFSYYDTIVYTHHGPVVYDRNLTSEKSTATNLAMKWTAHEGSKEIKALYLGNKAENYDEFVEAFSYFSGPPQNYSYASVNGDIALWINGKFPVKWEEQGKFLMDGSNIDHEWKAYMPQSHNLHVKNPPQNFVSSANQHPADSLYPYYQYDYHYEYYRGRRINDRLRVMDNIEVQDMMDLQHDNFNYNAFEALPMMMDSLDSSSFTDLEWEYYKKLNNWDYFNEPDRQAPTIYEVWWKKLNNKLWDEIDSSDVALYRPNWFNTVEILKKESDFFMIDNQSTSIRETSGDLYRLTFKETIEYLEDYLETEGNTLLWYTFKNTTIRHLLRISPFNRNKVKIGGNRSIVNAASSSHGPSWRMVVELGDGEVNAWGIYPGSQSGNPGNPTYGHMIDGWASGVYHPLLFEPKIDQKNDKIIHNITLKPAK